MKFRLCIEATLDEGSIEPMAGVTQRQEAIEKATGSILQGLSEEGGKLVVRCQEASLAVTHASVTATGEHTQGSHVAPPAPRVQAIPVNVVAEGGGAQS